ncbi:MAG: hypothetical protein VX566_02530 [Candidatus Thermoplasmatota archaeon]|jgi:hypothetical protein|nr:hypothetical protein [Candidatus Thermoplasmatota archaeon]|tara:strand:- start:59 stop:799 length:741 start_codon:yes stop_codon:yes gene_type:complete
MTKILGFAGKKQSGKNTCCNFLQMLKFHEYGVCKKASLNEQGQILVSDLFGETVSGVNWIPLTEEYVDISQLLESFGPCKIYAFADVLKEFAVDVLGLEHHQVYGTNKEKNSPTHLSWENMPTGNKEGMMTGREVLQYFGSDICRKMYENIWFDACIRRIRKDNPELALISDVRFSNEILGIKEAGGIVFGLPRDIVNGKDTHSSEQVDLSKCNYLLPEGNIDATTKALYKIISENKIHPFRSKVG